MTEAAAIISIAKFVAESGNALVWLFAVMVAGTIVVGLVMLKREVTWHRDRARVEKFGEAPTTSNFGHALGRLVKHTAEIKDNQSVILSRIGTVDTKTGMTIDLLRDHINEEVEATRETNMHLREIARSLNGGSKK